jgi:MFS transporter, DHA1 family, multidrug resistance protein
MTKRTYFTYVLILGLLTAIGPFSIDMYLPGFEDIARSLGTTTATVALSLSSYFIGIAAGQLIYGPLLDRYGRKKPLYVGLAVYIVATVCCMEAGNIQMLIALRFVQALGSCASMVAAMAMVRDLFGAKESAKVFSLLLLVLGASPLIAPTVGGYVVVTFGWRFVFLILAILSVLIMLLTIFFLPDSYPADPNFSLKPGPIIRNFLSVLRVPRFLTYALVQAFAFASLFAYVSGSPIVFMDIFHVDKRTYGWIFAFLSVAFIGLSQFTSLLLKRYPSEQIIPVAVAMAPFAKNAGTASSLLGVMQMGIGSLASIAVSVFANGRTTPMAGVMAVTSVTAVLIFVMGARQAGESN